MNEETSDLLKRVDDLLSGRKIDELTSKNLERLRSEPAPPPVETDDTELFDYLVYTCGMTQKQDSDGWVALLANGEIVVCAVNKRIAALEAVRIMTGSFIRSKK